MNASAGDTFDPERTVPNPETDVVALREAPAGRLPVIAPCLRAAPQSLLPSDFERAVMNTAVHARFTDRWEDVLRAKCRWFAAASASLLAFAALLALYLPTPWLAAVPAGLALGAAWRWAVFSAAADELRREAAR